MIKDKIFNQKPPKIERLGGELVPSIDSRMKSISIRLSPVAVQRLMQWIQRRPSILASIYADESYGDMFITRVLSSIALKEERLIIMGHDLESGKNFS